MASLEKEIDCHLLDIPEENYRPIHDALDSEVSSEDVIYKNDHEFVKEENLESFTEKYIEDLTAGEANELLREAMRRSEYEETIKSALFDFIKANGYAAFFDFKPVRGDELYGNTL
ncbi:hypothetical protein [Enterococcus alishanensis]